MLHIPVLGEAIMKCHTLEMSPRMVLITLLVQVHICWFLKIGTM